MECCKCEGLMVEEWLSDSLEEAVETAVWRCLNCGAVTDEIILRNRRLVQA